MFYEVVLPLLGMGMGMYAIVEGLRLGKRAMDQKHERDLAAAGGTAPGELEGLRDRIERLEEVGVPGPGAGRTLGLHRTGAIQRPRAA